MSRVRRSDTVITFEFILGPAGEFFFLEVNTRLQVEHPVTEAITGVDLVEWQLRVADGQPLPLAQEDIAASGHAIECRIYAEDPEDNFRPSPGQAVAVRWPPGVRVEAAFDEAGAVPASYDPMIAKLVTEGRDRAIALRRLHEAVRATSVLGVSTNLGFLGDLLQQERVVAGEMDTHLVDTLVASTVPRDRTVAAACAAAMTVPVASGPAASPWTGTIGPMDRGALSPDAPLGRMVTCDGGRIRHAAILERSRGRLLVDADGQRFSIALSERDGVFDGTAGGSRWTGLRTPAGFDVVVDGYRTLLVRPAPGPADAADADNLIRSAMPGTVVGVSVGPGDPGTAAGRRPGYPDARHESTGRAGEHTYCGGGGGRGHRRRVRAT
jgi:acetyl-CoA/propionyl-CoA carboxylase biotin carboxyl carrier protein